MDTKQRALLRSVASNADTIAQLGKEGLSPAFIAGVSDALSARELVKINVLRSVGDDLDDLARQVSEATKAEIVTVIGSKIVIYRKSDKEGVKHLLSDGKKRDPKIKPNSKKKTNFAGEHRAERYESMANETAFSKNSAPFDNEK